MKLVDNASPAGQALEMTADLVRQGRMSRAEQRTVENIIFHEDFPESLRRSPVAVKFDASGSEGRTRPAGWFAESN